MSRPHFPLGVLTHNAQLILSAAKTNTQIASRLPENYIAATEFVLEKLQSDIASQKTSHGELGTLTPQQHQNLETLQHWMHKARKTAKLAFARQDVKLHQEFQVGTNTAHDLSAILARADIIIASLQNAINVPMLAQRGWTAAETTAMITARGTFTSADLVHQNTKAEAKVSTTVKNADAADLYDRLQTIQNAADLQWPEGILSNAVIRDQFRFNTFPPTIHHVAAPSTAPSPESPPKVQTIP